MPRAGLIARLISAMRPSWTTMAPAATFGSKYTTAPHRSHTGRSRPSIRRDASGAAHAAQNRVADPWT